MEKIGEIGVDAGCVMVGDPCYVYQAEDRKTCDWDQFLAETYPKTFGPDVDPGNMQDMPDHAYARCEEGMGIVISSGYGDGIYPVLVERNSEGRVMRLIVEFGDPED